MKRGVLPVFLSLLLLLALVPGRVTANADRVSVFDAGLNRQSARFKNALLDKFEYEKQIFEKEKEIEKVKLLRDFDGNVYYCVEYSPAGYMIYHAQSGLISERSENDLSPYYGLENDLFYGGPTYYYQERTPEDTNRTANESVFYHHTILHETIAKIPSEWMRNSREANTALNTEAAVSIEEATPPAFFRSDNAALFASMTYEEVPYADFFSTMEDCGYFPEGNGICGYIALTMALSYFGSYSFYIHDVGYTDYLFVDSAYRVKFSNIGAKTGAKIPVSFTSYIRSIGRDLGIGTGTVSTDLKNICRAYFSRRGISGIKDASLYAPFVSNLGIYNSIRDGFPVMLFGSLEKPEGGKINHAVTVYKAGKPSNIFADYDFIAHFGWMGGVYTYVHVSGVWASSYRIYW